MSIWNSQAAPATYVNALTPAAATPRSVSAPSPSGLAPTRRPETVDLSSEARQPEQASRVGGLMAALEDMVRDNTERAVPANNPSKPEDLQEKLKAAKAKGDEQAVASLEQQIKNLNQPQTGLANGAGGVANANADASGSTAGVEGAAPTGSTGQTSAPDYSDALAPANTKSLKLEADGRPGLEAALRKAGYSAEQSRSGRVLNQIMQDNSVASLDSLKAGSRLSVPTNSQGGDGGSQGFAFQNPGFLNGSGAGGFGRPGGIGGGSVAGGGYQSAFPAPAWNGGNPDWGTKPAEDNSGFIGGAGVKPQRQNYDNSCGQSSVAMAVNSLTGKNLTDHDIRRKYGMSLLTGLNSESRGSGYRWADNGNFSRSKWPLLEKKLNQEKTPVLIGLNGPAFSPSGRGHVVTLMSIDGNKVRYADPADGKIKVTTRQAIESARPHPDGKFLFTASKG